ncbi:Hypothetical protein PHPALM_183 [Phytophthora palmivora]|uniref:Uncharacterized protein n=1 Tax=Phytophthora palmivora TaxID=4796 RepID=A0A2P4YVH8_9STRA|nr:Hypothetical protein PHPALM_183 [Phytophthora palmivora]
MCWMSLTMKSLSVHFSGSCLMLGVNRLVDIGYTNHINSDALRAAAWSAPSSAFDSDPTSYPQLLNDVAGPIVELRDRVVSTLALLIYA